jgi:hypothetical protein
MSEINYTDIKSIVQYGVRAGLISEPIPMKRDEIVKRPSSWGVPYSKKSWAVKICESRREEILTWVDEGQSQAQIANKLGMSTGPVSRFILLERNHPQEKP